MRAQAGVAEALSAFVWFEFLLAEAASGELHDSAFTTSSKVGFG